MLTSSALYKLCPSVKKTKFVQMSNHKGINVTLDKIRTTNTVSNSAASSDLWAKKNWDFRQTVKLQKPLIVKCIHFA